MSFESKIDRMASGHSAEYQDELMLGRKLHAFMGKLQLHMHYGYPASVYRPRDLYKTPKQTPYRFKPGGMLSNGVPKVLSGELIEGYLLGVYNPPANNSEMDSEAP